MVKTFLLVVSLTAISFFLWGINVGKRIGQPSDPPDTSVSSPSSFQASQSAHSPPATQPPLPSLSPSRLRVIGVTSFTDERCGFSLSLPASFARSKTEHEKSLFFANPDNPNDAVAAACAPDIPKPPVSDDRTIQILLGGQTATLYHDQNPDGTSRDEVIVSHPTNGQEIIIAGYGDSFIQALSSFRFVK